MTQGIGTMETWRRSFAPKSAKKKEGGRGRLRSSGGFKDDGLGPLHADDGSEKKTDLVSN